MELSTGLAITGLLAALYGFGFAVVPKAAGDSPSFQKVYVMGGAALIAVVALATVIIPWIGEQ